MILIDFQLNVKVRIFFKISYGCILDSYVFLIACKYLTSEISDSLLKHDSHGEIETGYNLDERLDKKEKKKYKDS